MGKKSNNFISEIQPQIILIIDKIFIYELNNINF